MAPFSKFLLVVFFALIIIISYIPSNEGRKGLVSKDSSTQILPPNNKELISTLVSQMAKNHVVVTTNDYETDHRVLQSVPSPGVGN
ncbi:hypothetical protein CsatB_000126 [Cannabis sativa]